MLTWLTFVKARRMALARAFTARILEIMSLRMRAPLLYLSMSLNGNP